MSDTLVRMPSTQSRQVGPREFCGLLTSHRKLQRVNRPDATSLYDAQTGVCYVVGRSDLDAYLHRMGRGAVAASR